MKTSYLNIVYLITNCFVTKQVFGATDFEISPTLIYHHKDQLSDVVDDVLIRYFGEVQSTVNLISFDGKFSKFCDEENDFVGELMIKVMRRNEVAVIFETVDEIGMMKKFVRHNNILVMKSEKKLSGVLNKENFNLQGNFLIMILEESFKKTQEIFNLLWKKRIINANVIFTQNNKTFVQTFFPFNDIKCNDTSQVNIRVSKNEKNANFFPQKLKNLRNCSIRAGVTQNKPYIFKKESKGKIKLSGREIDLVNALSAALNFNVNFVYVNDSGALHANGTSTGTFKMLIEDKVDLIVGNNNLKPNRLKFIENTTPYITSQITFLIPPGQQLTSFESLFSPLRFKVWICILVYFAFGSIVIFIIKRRSKCDQNFVFGANVKDPYMNMLNAIFGGSQEVEPRGNFARFLLMMFLVFCLVMRTLYCGSLYRFLQSDIHHHEVESIDEMLAKGFKFYVSTSSMDLYESDPKFNGR